MIDLGKEKPVVMCPGCKAPMQPREFKPILFSNGMTDVTYVCETCGMSTIRMLRNDDKRIQ
jgi:RNase P subunit RPR2